MDLIATLDNTTVGSVEKWLEQENVSPNSRPTTRPTGLSARTATTPKANTDERAADSSSPSLEAAKTPFLDCKKTAAVQPQVRHNSLGENDITLLPPTSIYTNYRCLRYSACNMYELPLIILWSVQERNPAVA